MNGSDVLIFVAGILDLLTGSISDFFSKKLNGYVISRSKSRYTSFKTPPPSKEFHCFRIGNFEIPAMSITGSPDTPFHFEEVKIKFHPEMKEEKSDYPIELKAARQYLIQECVKRFNLKSVDENILPRLDDIEQGGEQEGDKRGDLSIHFSLTHFASLCATNLSVDQCVIPRKGLIDQFTANQTIREAYTTLPYSELSKSILANAPGVEVIVISRNLNQTPQDQLIIRRRGQTVSFFRGYYQSSAAGYMSLTHSTPDGLPNPFVTAVAEARQEIADSLTSDPKEFHLIGLMLQWQVLHPAFYGYIVTGKSIQDLLGDFKRDSYEGVLSAIPFEPKTILTHLAKEKWTATSTLAVISTLLAFYPRKEIESIARDLPAKNWKDFLENV